MRNLFAYSYPMKLVGALCILWGLYLFLFGYWQYKIADLNLLTGISCWGLVFIFFSKEKIDDERVHQLKFQAVTWALPVGLAITQLVNYLFINEHGQGPGEIYQSISAYQSLVIILLIALGLFQYLKRSN